MFVYVHNGWPWLDFISEIVFRINCHKPINCHHQSTVTTNQLSQPINRHNQSINCHHQSTVTANHNDRWIGLGGPMAWSPTSPDLTPMPLFLRGHIKTLIYSSPFDSEAISLNICTKLVRSTFFFQNTSVVLLDFQIQSDPIWRSLVLQEHISDIYFPDNKSLFWSPPPITSRVWAWNFFRTRAQYVASNVIPTLPSNGPFAWE